MSLELGDVTNQHCRRLNSCLRKNIFSIEELDIRTQTGSQLDYSKIVCHKMSCKPYNEEPASEENKQFDPGGK